MKKPSYERALNITFATVWLLITVLSAALCTQSDKPLLLSATVAMLFLLPLALILYKIKQVITQPLYRLSSVLEAIGLEDYGQRLACTDKDGILHELQQQLDGLNIQLQSHKSERDHQAITVLRLIEQLPSPIAVFDEHLGLAHGNEAFSNWIGKPWQTRRLAKAEKFGLTLTEGRWQFNDTSLQAEWQIKHSKLKIANENAHLVVLTDVHAVVSQAQREAWQKMIRVLSHEIHNSLSPIKSLAQSLKEMPTTDEFEDDAQQALEVIVQRSDSLMTFVNRYASVATQHHINLQPLRANALLPPIVQLFEPQCSLQLKNDFMLRVDQALIEQVLVNLIKNAIEASPKGAQIILCGYQDEQYTVLEVLDQGHGIKNKDNLFVPFYTTKPRGKGIGLSLSRQIVEQHGGKLTLENRSQQQGAVAKITLPRR
ncbi:sensor histidine kinase [Pseudoalteromonas sp. T1lg65]|uniref:sensor histidine kinase n=1 Tax=Pseudoalteromonas sp. T1lg65 TaxID=2077101 RepID=UPI003F7B03E1